MALPGIVIHIAAETSKAISEIGKVDKALRSQATRSERFGAALSKAAVPATAALAAIGAGAAKAVNAASDMQQALGATESVFGKAAAGIQKFGETAATQLGISQTEFNNLAAVSGAMLQNLGFNANQAASKTEDLAQRAADLASVFGGTTADAMDAMNAALRGEFDSLEKYGVKLSQTAVDQKVAAMNLDTSTEAAKRHSQAQAALALIMDQSASAAGNFAAEAGSVAGGTQILGAQISDLWAQLGQALLPVVQQVVGYLKQFATWAQSNVGAIQAMVAAVAALSAGILAAKAGLAAYKAVQTVVMVATKAWRVAQLALNVVLSANPIGLVVTAVAALVAGLVYAYNHSETFRRAVQAVWQFLKAAFITALRAVQSALSTVGDWLGRVASTVSGAFRSAWSSVVGVFDTVRNAIASVIGTIQSVISWISNAIAKVREFFSSGIGKIGGFIGGLFRSGGGAAPAVMARAATGRATTTMGGSSTVVLNNTAYNPHYTAHELQRILTGARVRTGYSGVRA